MCKGLSKFDANTINDGMNTVIEYTYDERLEQGHQAKVNAIKHSEKSRSAEFSLLIKVKSENNPEGLLTAPIKFKRTEGVTSCLQCRTTLTQASDHHVVHHGLSSVHLDLNRKKAKLVPLPKSVSTFFNRSSNATSSSSSSSSSSGSKLQSTFLSTHVPSPTLGTSGSTSGNAIDVTQESGTCQGITWPLKPFSTTFAFVAADNQGLQIGYAKTSAETGSLFIGKCMYTRQPKLHGESHCCDCNNFVKGYVSPNLSILKLRALDPELHLSTARNAVLNQAQLVKRGTHHIAQKNTLKLASLARVRDIRCLKGQRQDYKLIMHMLATNDFVRLRALLAQLAKRSKNPKKILLVLGDAVDGLYKCSHHKTLKEKDMLLLLKSVCPKLIYSFNEFTGLGSRSLADVSRREGLRFVTSACEVTEEEIKHNLECSLQSLLQKSGFKKSAWHMMLDGIHSCPSVAPDLTTGKLQGLCTCFAEQDISVNVNTEERARELISFAYDAKKTDLHFSSEILVFAFGANSLTNYHPRVALAIGICSHATSAFFARMVKLLLRVWKKHFAEEYGECLTVNCDGAPTQAVLLQHAVEARDDKFEEILKLLSNCPFLPESLGMVGRDVKHWCKRQRTAGQRTDGVKVLGVALTPALQSEFLIDLQLLSEREAKEIFMKEKDAMNVKAAYNYAQAMSKLKTRCVGDLSAAFVEKQGNNLTFQWNSLVVYSEYCECIAILMAGKELTLTAHMENLSKLAALMFFLHRLDGTSFCPAQHVSNTMRIVHSMYWAVAGSKVNGYEHFFLHLNGTDMLEQLFAMIRLCSGNSNTNVRANDFADKLQAALDLLSIKARGLVAFDSNRRLDKGVDHLKPQVWIRNEEKDICYDRVEVKDVSLKMAWRTGWKTGVVFLRAAGYSSSAISDAAISDLRTKGLSIYCLFKKDDYTGLDSAAQGDATEAASAIESNNDFVNTVEIDNALDAATLPELPPGHSEERNYNHRFIKMVKGVHGEDISLARVCVSAFKRNNVVTSRCARVKHSSFKESTAAGDDDVEDIMLAGSDVVGVFIKTDDGVVSLAVASTIGFRADDKSAWDTWAPSEHEGSHELRVKLNIFKIEQLELEYTSYAFLPSSSIGDLTVRGCHIFPISVEHVARAEEGSVIGGLPRMPVFVCEMKKALFLQEARAAFVDMDEEHKNTIKVEGSNSKLPYRMNCGTKLWVTIIMKQAGEIRLFETKKTKFRCNFCPGVFTASLMIEHMAWHRHHDSTFNESRVHAAYPCGSCGLHSVQKGDSNGCQVWMSGTKKAPSCRWICKSFMRGQEQKKGLKSWEKVASSAPSRDFPLLCPIKDCAIVHWKYNLGKHFAQMHKGATMDQATKNRILLKPKEKELLLKYASSKSTLPAAAAAASSDDSSSDSSSDSDGDDNGGGEGDNGGEEGEGINDVA
jgi:hypothetical protein